MDTFLYLFEDAFLVPAYNSLRAGIENGPCRYPGRNSTATSTEAVETRLEDVCGTFTHSSFWQPDDPARQFLSSFLYLWITTTISYIFLGVLFYHLNFKTSSTKDPKFKPEQIRGEITSSLLSILVMSLLTAPIVLAQAWGYSKIYKFGEASLWYEGLQMILFVCFNDTCVYWLHRLFHVPFLFKLMHQKHHLYVVPTPFSAFAFDPLEAMIMSLPIYCFSFLVPTSNIVQIVVFTAGYIWTFLSHDDRDQFHTVHHKNINFNFGQYTTLWDRWGGTYMDEKIFLARARGRSKGD